ncbi:MAG: RNA polymerase sigma factor [Bacteroidota bacterium]
MVKVYPEKEIIKGCKAGERKHQHALYERYHKKMYGVCLRYMTDPEMAQDMLQEGFFKVFKNIHSCKGSGSLEGWVRRIVIHTCIEHLRRAQKISFSGMEGVTARTTDLDAISLLSHQEILHLIQQLPPGYRTVFNLYVVEGYTHPEISKLLNISVGTSKSQLAKSKQHLRRLLNSCHIRITQHA